jgi:hypothetical protein
MMKNKKAESSFVVDYMSGSSMIHEFMTQSKYMHLLQVQKEGFVKIMHHTDLGIQARAH